MGPGLKNGVIRSKRKNRPLKLSLVPFCQQSQIARSAWTISRIFGPGDSNFTENRRSLWPLTWVPRPRMNRPSEAFARSQAMCARIIGLRGNATAIAVPSLTREVTVAATASGRNGSCCVSEDQRQSKPSASARRGAGGGGGGGGRRAPPPPPTPPSPEVDERLRDVGVRHQERLDLARRD